MTAAMLRQNIKDKLCTIQEVGGEKKEKKRKNLVRVVSVSAELQNEHLPNLNHTTVTA